MTELVMASGTGSRKQETSPKTITWPVAPDGFIPNSVVRSLAPYPRFSIDREPQLEEDKTLDLRENWHLEKALLKRYCLREEPEKQEDVKGSLEQDIQSQPEKANVRASFNLPLPYQSAVSETETKTRQDSKPPRRVLPQTQYKFPRKDPSPVQDLQANASSVQQLQKDPPVAELQEDASAEQELLTNTAVEELKNEEDDGKHSFNLRENVPQGLCAFPRKKAKKKSKKANFKLPKMVAVRPKLQRDKKVFSIKEQTESIQESKTVHAAEVAALKQHKRQKTDPPIKKMKILVTPPLLGDRRPDPILMYFYKRAKAESESSGVKRAQTCQERT